MYSTKEPDAGTPARVSEKLVTLQIDGMPVTVPSGTSVMRAAFDAGVRVPKLCATDHLEAFGSCRLCLVEIEGRRGFPASCTTPVEAGMKVTTQSDRLARLRRNTMELYISDHPLWGHEGTLARRATVTTADVAELSGGSMVTLGGVVSKLERKTTRRGDQMILVTLEDFHGTVEVTLFSKVAAAQGSKLREDGVVLIKARVNQNDDRITLSATDIEPIKLTNSVSELRLNLPTDSIGRNSIDELREILRRHPGDSRVYLHLGPGKILQLGSEFAVEIDRVVPELRVAFGIDVVLPAV